MSKLFKYDQAADGNPPILGPCCVVDEIDEHNDVVSWQFVTCCSGCVHWDAGGRSLSGAHGCQRWLITTPPEFYCAGAEPCER